MSGNPSPNTPGAPYSGKAYERFKRWYWSHVLHKLPGSKRQRIVRYARASLAYHGRMHYTETVRRSELFHRKRGDFDGAHADCSQYSATLCHWVGVVGVTDTDWTGTLCHKGQMILSPQPGCFVFFGTAPFVHMAVMVDKKHAVGFGSQSSPDESSLAGLVAYFASQGHPGYEFRDLTTR
jgi:hypothetical protein